MAAVPKHVRVLLPHNSQPDHDVEEIGGSVLAHLYVSPAKDTFTTPPVDQPTLQTQLGDFTVAIAATVVNGHTTQLLVTADPIAKATSWQLEMATVAANGALSDWKLVGVFSGSRKMLAAGLTPGATYAFHVRAVGGSTGYSDWSDPAIDLCD